MLHFIFHLLWGLERTMPSLVLVFLILMKQTICHGQDTSVRSCPNKCVCQHDEASKTNTVSCIGANFTNIVESLPANTAELSFSQDFLGNFDVGPLLSFSKLKKLIVKHCEMKSVIFPAVSNDGQDAAPNLEILDLSHNQLTEVPLHLPNTLKAVLLSYNRISEITVAGFAETENLHELFLDHNLISEVRYDSFRNVDGSHSRLKTLQKLALNSNQVYKIDAKAFEEFSSLSALSLSNNKISDLKTDTFYGAKYLHHLDLSRNALVMTDKYVFSQLQGLRSLDLSHNSLIMIPNGIPMLEWLDLSHNDIRTISEGLKTVLYPVEVWNIAHNPLHCDCNMRWLKELYDRREHVVKHMELDPKEFIPTCVSPAKLAGESWDNLGDDVFVCDEPSKRQRDRNPRASNLDMSVRVGVVTDTTIQVLWSFASISTPSDTNVLLQYYVFGLRGVTMKHVEVSAGQRDYILKHLKAETNYVVCATAKKGDNHGAPSDISLENCVEISTHAPKPVQITSYVTIIWYYVLGMLATFIAIIVAIGGIAMLYSMLNSKNTDWSAKYAAANQSSFLDGSESSEAHPESPDPVAERITYMTDMPISVRKLTKEHRD